MENQRENVSKRLKTVAQQQNEAIENDNFEEADHLEVVTMELNENVNSQIFSSKTHSCWNSIENLKSKLMIVNWSMLILKKKSK